MWDETSSDRHDRKRNGSPRARDEACFQDVALGAIQDEYDHDDGHGAYWCCGPTNGRLIELDIRNKFFFALVLSVPIILYSPLGKFIFGIQLPAPLSSSLASLPTNDSGLLLLRLDLPLL